LEEAEQREHRLRGSSETGAVRLSQSQQAFTSADIVIVEENDEKPGKARDVDDVNESFGEDGIMMGKVRL
jgi:hypothetical protein